MENRCAGCGMTLKEPYEYHPYAACELFKATGSSESARLNIRAMIRYGMDAERQGVSLDDACGDLRRVTNA